MSTVSVPKQFLVTNVKWVATKKDGFLVCVLFSMNFKPPSSVNDHPGIHHYRWVRTKKDRWVLTAFYLSEWYETYGTRIRVSHTKNRWMPYGPQSNRELHVAPKSLIREKKYDKNDDGTANHPPVNTSDRAEPSELAPNEWLDSELNRMRIAV